METSLHRQLKERYATGGARTEVPLGSYRIDVVRGDESGDELIEIQHGSLAAIRDKVQRLLRRHRVRIVKPIVAHKMLVHRAAKGGRVVRRRKSPKQGNILDLFDELIYFTRTFPHRRLTLEVPLVSVEEWRYPGHGRRRRRRRRDFQIEDQLLIDVHQVHEFRTADDLGTLLPGDLPRPFHTGHLAEGLGVERWIAQRIAYCLRHMGTVSPVGKQGNALLYKFAA